MAKPFLIESEPLPGVYVIKYPRFVDDRGLFLKGYNRVQFQDIGILFEPAEQFLSCSALGVLRGMHFQTGTSAHEKLVICPIGKVLDVVVDVRPTSKHFNQPISVELSGESPRALFIGKGYAHGFLSLTDNAWMQYFTSTVHDPGQDTGVLWSSIAFNWPIKNPILSARDSVHPPIGFPCKFS